jgi:MoxR-like ATPase
MALVQGVLRQVGRRVVGQEYMVERLLISLLTGGHVLLEGVPGLAKTLTVRTLAETIDTSFQRIQFTDLLPADVLGTQVSDQSTENSRSRGAQSSPTSFADVIGPGKGPAAPSSVQEKQVTSAARCSGRSRPRARDAEPHRAGSTYPLPKRRSTGSCLLRVGYPSRDEEKEIMRRRRAATPFRCSTSRRRRRSWKRAIVISDLYMDERIVDYRSHRPRDAPPAESEEGSAPLIEFGGVPAQRSRSRRPARARVPSGPHVRDPEDVKAIAPDVLRHRVPTTYEAEAEEVTSDTIVGKTFDDRKPMNGREAGDGKWTWQREARPEGEELVGCVETLRARHALRTPPKPPSAIGARFPIPGSLTRCRAGCCSTTSHDRRPPECSLPVKLIEPHARARELVFSGEYRSVFKGQG